MTKKIDNISTDKYLQHKKLKIEQSCNMDRTTPKIFSNTTKTQTQHKKTKRIYFPSSHEKYNQT